MTLDAHVSKLHIVNDDRDQLHSKKKKRTTVYAKVNSLYIAGASKIVHLHSKLTKNIVKSKKLDKNC